MSSGRRFVFLDRDGTLLRDRGYTHRAQDYELLPGVIPGLRRLEEAGYALAIVTNQSGIGRGYFSEDDFHAFHQQLLDELAAADVRIEATYFCPHHPDEGCPCRKPATGMLERAERELGAALAESWVIGDSEVDAQLAARAGCRAVRIGGTPDPAPSSALHAGDLPQAAALIADLGRLASRRSKMHR